MTSSKDTMSDIPIRDLEKGLLELTRHSSEGDILPTLLLSPSAASFISTFAASTRVSLRVATCILEALLETSQCSTRLSLSYTRRLLINALSFARDAPGYPFNLTLGAGSASGPGRMILAAPESTESFLLLLDKYTSMGIHIVQHTFSLVELFTMSGFYLTASAVQSAHAAAQESVALLDGLFGSTQSSRALAAIIDMIRRELDSGQEGGSKVGLAGLTKAVTAFACLQVATWERTRGRMKMVAAYDYLVQPVSSRQIESASATQSLLVDRDTELRVSQCTARAAGNASGSFGSPTGASLVEPRAADSDGPRRKRRQTSESPSSSSKAFPDRKTYSDPLAGASKARSHYTRSRSLDLTGDLFAGLAMSSLTDQLLQRGRPRERVERGCDSAAWRPTGRIASPELSPLTSMGQMSDGTCGLDGERSWSSSTSGLAAGDQAFQAGTTTCDATSPPSRTAAHVPDDMLSASHFLAPSNPPDISSENFPRRHLLQNLHHFMRYSAAAYGQAFLRVFGTGTSDYAFTSTAQHHSNSWAFAKYTGLPIECLLLTSYVDATPLLDGHKAPPLVHYVAVDHSAKAIVLTCRGTLGLSDILVDLTCEYQDVDVPHASRDGEHYVHQGMYEAALGLCAQGSKVHRTIVTALRQYPDYGLVICGHSLGGGVAALLALLSGIPASSLGPEYGQTPFVTSPASAFPPGRPIHCYAYGPPAVMSPDLAKYAQGLVTSIVQDSDIVPCLSIGSLRDLKNIATTMAEEDWIAEDIFRRVVGVRRDALSGPPEDLGDWLVALANTLRADMNNDKLYPPGTVYIMEVHETLTTVKGGQGHNREQAARTARAHRAILRRCTSVEERFREPIFARTMMNDHLPSNYERSTHLLLQGMLQDTT